jgi:hypothetical protein
MKPWRAPHQDIPHGQLWSDVGVHKPGSRQSCDAFWSCATAHTRQCACHRVQNNAPWSVSNWRVDTYLPHYKASHHRSPQSWYSPPSEPLVSQMVTNNFILHWACGFPSLPIHDIYSQNTECNNSIVTHAMISQLSTSMPVMGREGYKMMVLASNYCWITSVYIKKLKARGAT